MTFGWFPDSINQAKKTVNTEILDYGNLDIKQINVVDFPEDQYYRNETEKNQIVIHHTVSGDGVLGDINWWKMTKDRVATHVIIDRNGAIYQCYSSKYWGHHLGVSKDFLKNYGFTDWQTRNVLLNKRSIGIELDSWGGLVKGDDNKFYPAKYNENTKKFDADMRFSPILLKNVVEYKDGFRGFNFFEKYTTEQIMSLAQLIKYWGKAYNIPISYNPDMWDISDNALSGISGVWGHISYRKDKSDVHPDNKLIKMLKSL